MSAESINIITIDFPNPYSANGRDTNHFNPLSKNNSFQFPINNGIRTLSSKGVERGEDPYGILFVPDLQTDDCKKTEEAYVANNATRLKDLPANTNYALIAFAPWFSPTCMLQYFETARVQPVKAFIVYQPQDATSTQMPPDMNDPSWGLGDGGSWQFANQFPTYAIPAASGTLVTTQLSLYSGNISSVPYGDELEGMFDLTDYIRLWAKVQTDPGSQLPNLWVFLVIVLGLLIVVLGSTSLCMHIVQRARRNSLRQRVINGEVDLEALGVKRLTVPEEFLRKLPNYAYPSGPPDPEKTNQQSGSLSHPVDAETGAKGKLLGLSPRMSNSAAAANRASTSFSQSSCAICLDDFEPTESQVRELPCRHIFHVDCIDPFLLNNSSLCPICKQSVLPTGYCPPRITNVMVRRERMISRRRARSGNGQSPVSNTLIGRLPWAYDSVRARMSGRSGGHRAFSAPARTQSRPSEIEMTSSTTAPAPGRSVSATLGSEILPVPAPAMIHDSDARECPRPTSVASLGREWPQERNVVLVGDGQIPFISEDEEQSSSRWKRGIRKIFPGFR